MRALKPGILTMALTMAMALWASHAIATTPAQEAQATRAASRSAQAQEPPAPGPTAPAQQVRANSRYSADSLYNQANSYARAGKPGLAVLHYERAALLSPNDPDINANLDYVRAAANVALEPRTRLTRTVQIANPTEAAWLGVAGIALLGAGVLTNKATRRYRGLRATSLLLGIGLVSLTVCNAVLLWPRLHEAVVLINQTPARVSPVPMGDTAFLLREAETVTVTAEHEDFILVRTRTGRTGWVARANIGAVMP
jgi:hypothetical protein